ncbi:hypothetical protein [Pontibacter sp. SGAir0037]|uniref:hypothetical protein n=1 Tax=Pontibacter sp. SGAir0037 TaxID=2571030 RepID=UPI0010F84B4D|nr:hypothetical protein [Pontibacter sp. SGAir0037]
MKSGYGVQLVLFTDLLPNGKKQESNRRTYTTHDIRMVKQDYTHGWIKGPEMAEKLGVPYPSFKQFVKRNPDLKKGYHTKLSPFSAT